MKTMANYHKKGQEEAKDVRRLKQNNSKTNPLVRMCNELKGNEKFACIYLDEDVRSSTSKIFAQLFEQ